MELKYLEGVGWKAYLGGYNRTFMELKSPNRLLPE